MVKLKYHNWDQQRVKVLSAMDWINDDDDDDDGGGGDDDDDDDDDEDISLQHEFITQ